ncbi:MAG: glycosyltransferase [Clostridia bacterium]|nr:glycosyltransferase [Clostridia bacterium]
MEKKKILIVAHHLTVGGVQKSLISALKALDYDKYDVTLYLRKNRTDLLQFIDGRVRVIINEDSHHYYRKPYAILLQTQELLYKLLKNNKKAENAKAKLARKIADNSMQYEHHAYFVTEKYDVAVAYVQGYVAEFVADYINADKKIVFFHTSTDDHHEMHERILPVFDTVVALHEQQQALIEKWYPETCGKIKIVENYSDGNLVREQSKAFEIDKTSRLCLCSCGRLAVVKGFDLAVQAAEILNNHRLDFVWFFVGDGPERQRLERLISDKGLEKRIVITGMKKNPYPYMAACDIYVQPSYEEASPMTISEVCILKKPIVSTATVGGKKLIDDGVNGLLCDINAEAIAEAVRKLSDSKSLYNSVKGNLKNQDNLSEFEAFKSQWKDILEG